MTIEQEEKALKMLGVFALLCFIPLTQFVKNDAIKLIVIIPFLVAFSILHFRKYKRDKKAGVNLVKYNIMLGFIIVSFILFLGFSFMPF